MQVFFLLWWINWNGLAFLISSIQNLFASTNLFGESFFFLFFVFLFLGLFSHVQCDQQLKIDKSESERHAIRRYFSFSYEYFFLIEKLSSHPEKNSIEMENDIDKKCCVNFLFFPFSLEWSWVDFFSEQMNEGGSTKFTSFPWKAQNLFRRFFSTASLSKKFSGERDNFTREKKISTDERKKPLSISTSFDPNSDRISWEEKFLCWKFQKGKSWWKKRNAII